MNPIQKLLVWITPTFSRSSLLLMGVVFVSLAFIDSALGQLFRPVDGQTWLTNVGMFAVVFGIPILYSLYASFSKKNVPQEGQNILIVISSLVYFFIGNIAGWNTFVDNALHPNTILGQIKDALLFVFAFQSYILLVAFIGIVVVRYQNKKLNLSQVFDDSVIHTWLIPQILLAFLLPYIGLHLLHYSWIQNLAFSTFLSVGASKLYFSRVSLIKQTEKFTA